ncbi:MAG: hypothetical protein HGA85_01235 [Nanoarchaeota archaeon]|nr:hypothetical protein [Nanoarchaeota archaeon]
MQKIRIFVVGNSLVDIDSLPLRILPELRKKMPSVDFVEFDPTEEFPVKDPIILDTVINAETVSIFTDINKIELQSICSLHDFDLGYNLKLLKKLGQIKSVKIIGVPPNIEEAVAVEEICKILLRN